MVRQALVSAVLSLSLLAAPLSAEEKPGMETDWLEFVKGYKGEKMGAEVREVEEGEDGEGAKLVIAIPKVAMTEPSQIEEVRVVAQAPEELDLIPEFEYEWVDNYANHYYGLVIRFSDETRWPIRLYMRSHTGYQDCVPSTVIFNPGDDQETCQTRTDNR